MCAFFTRLSLDDIQVKQLTGDTLTMSGVTDFTGTLKSRGVEIDGTTGGTGYTGYVLTFTTGNTISLQQNAAIGTGTYDGNRSITRTSIIPQYAGNVGGITVSQFLDGYFFPDVPPNALILLFSGNTAREYGDATDSNTGDVLEWQSIEKTNPIIQSGITVNGVSFDPDSGGTTTGTTNYLVVSGDTNPITGGSVLQTSETFSMSITTLTAEVSVSTVTVSWKNKVFWFSASTKYVTGDDTLVENILNTGVTMGSSLATTRVRVFATTLFNDAYFYYVYPKHFGKPVFTVNGLPNNAWGSLPIHLFEMTYTNVNGYTEKYYVASSDNKLDNIFEINCN